ncbi:MAG: translation initiation factor IF-2 [Prolixibacteraceae bacterium]|nr:translation initiation factor IF-2 [Prolixibacteraceae bacterium]
MVSGTGTQRLGKVAREFNVGIQTMVEFLHKKGHVVDPNPNAKIDDEQYIILQKEYSKDIDLKKESEKLNLRTHRHQKNESLTIDDIYETESEQSEEKEDEEVFRITDHSAKKTVPIVPREKEVEEIKTFTPKKEIKVVGKIDLEKKPEPKSASESVTEQKPIEKKEAEPVKPVEQKLPEPEKNKTVEQPEPVVPQIKEEPKPVEKKEVKPFIFEEETEEEVEITPSNEIITNVPKVENDLKVVGRIDLTSLNQRTRPPKKSKKQKEEERRARDNQKRQESSGATTSPANQARPERQGAQPGQPAPQSAESRDNRPPRLDDAARKKKRKRIQKERVDISSNSANNASPVVSGEKKDLAAKKGPGPVNKFQQQRNRKRPVHQEVSEEDVQKQVKDTLARLTTKSKSKGSKYRREKRAAFTERLAHEEAVAQENQSIIKITEFVSVNELANMMNVTATQVISTCMALGLFVSINQRLDAETMSIVAEEFGFKVEFISADVMQAIEEEVDTEESLMFRPPIVTVMGHVDHGKTSLLDYIRSSNVIAGEAGGITQHIGAYNVELPDGRKITFLDTPGHEAFTAMRARGAQVTDIAIIIVAADDNVMPQTVEAINHAAAAGVPIVFAINKIDKPGANPEAIKERLAQMNYLVEEWGGKYQSHDISAKSGIGIEELLEKVLLEAEMLDLKANPNKRAIGSVIESSLDRGRGFVATVLVQNGTLREGDVILAGPHMGHVKAMFNERNQRIKEAKPAEPALVLGLNGAPQAGDKFNVMASEREARQIANKREQLQREQGMRTQKHITLDEIGRRIAIGNFQELNVIVKGDVDGSIEALSDSLIKLSTPEIQVNVKHKAVGQISESDVMLASASDAIIIGFQVRPSLAARKLAEQEEIDIRLYSIIYDAIEEIKAAMEGMLSPEIKEEILGTAEIQEVFKITKVGTVAGCIVRDGKIIRNNKIRVIRDGIVIYTGELGSLKRFKEDVREVTHGYECGMNVSNFNDLKAGDLIESFKEVEIAKKL